MRIYGRAELLERQGLWEKQGLLIMPDVTGKNKIVEQQRIMQDWDKL
jgi:hypothetical protein